MKYTRKLMMTGAATTVMVLASTGAVAQDTSAQPAEARLTSSFFSEEDIVVTARRREENVQTVPVSIQAFSGSSLAARGIFNTDDVQKLVPGVVFTGASGTISTTYFIRGQGRDTIGSALPSVINYLNDVPLTPSSSLLPTYDISSLQVLKGPQGTLFGRNTTGGAVLVSTAPPVHEFTGYVQALYGSYDWVDIQGATNVPLIQDKLAIRVAGELTRRDGYTKEQFGRKDKDDRHEDFARVSLLFEPTETIRNTTVFDYFTTETAHTGIVPFGGDLAQFIPYRQGNAQRAFGPALGTLIANAFDCPNNINCNVDMQRARQAAAGPRKTWHDAPSRAFQEVWGISNTTVVELGDVTFKNIFGYRTQRYVQNTDADGTSLPLLNTYNFQRERQITNEVQLSGSFMDDRLDWLVGAFYLNTKPIGAYGAKFDIYRPSSIPQDAWFLSTVQNAMYRDKSKAVFANVGYSFDGALSGLRLNGAIRYTVDKEAACSLTTGPFSTPPIDGWDKCLVTPGATTARDKFKKVTWQAGVDYAATEDVFLYLTARTGYRAGQLNTPVLGGRLTPFQSYAPQTVLDFEAGAKTNWNVGSVKGRFNTAAFRTKIKGYQRQISAIPSNFDQDNNPLTDPSFTSLVVNGGTAVIKGVEVDGFISPIDGLTVTYAAAYLKPKFTEITAPPVLAPLSRGAPTFDKAPEWSAAVGGELRLPVAESLGQFYLTANYYWVDSHFVNLSVYPSHDTLDASLQWREVGGRPLTLTAFVNNLTKSEYPSFNALTGASPGFATGVYNPPRMFGVRARYDF